MFVSPHFPLARELLCYSYYADVVQWIQIKINILHVSCYPRTFLLYFEIPINFRSRVPFLLEINTKFPTVLVL